jgi:hypothetical protein
MNSAREGLQIVPHRNAPMLREYRPHDAEPLCKVALEAFEQFRSDYSDWPAMADRVSRMSDLPIPVRSLLPKWTAKSSGVWHTSDPTSQNPCISIQVGRLSECSSSSQLEEAMASVGC